MAAGTEDIGGVLHKGRVPFMLRGITAQVLPRNSQGVYWRMKLPNGKYYQSALTSHAQQFGFGSDRMSLTPEIIWKPGERIYIDLDTILAGPPPVGGYTAVFMFEGIYRFPIPGNGAVSHPVDSDRPRYFLAENQNILAPESAFWPGCPSETPPGYVDEEFCYVSPVVELPVDGSPVSNIPIQIDEDSAFIMREVWPHFPDFPDGTDPNGEAVIRMRRNDGYPLSSTFLPIDTIRGPVFKEFPIRAGGVLYFDARFLI
jgi:hypothetical protein